MSHPTCVHAMHVVMPFDPDIGARDTRSGETGSNLRPAHLAGAEVGQELLVGPRPREARLAGVHPWPQEGLGCGLPQKTLVDARPRVVQRCGSKKIRNTATAWSDQLPLQWLPHLRDPGITLKPNQDEARFGVSVCCASKVLEAMQASAQRRSLSDIIQAGQHASAPAHSLFAAETPCVTLS